MIFPTALKHPKFHVRFGVGELGTGAGFIWSLFGHTEKRDIYIRMPGVSGRLGQKISLHPNTSRVAFLEKPDNWPETRDRSFLKWQRNRPPPIGALKLSQELVILVPTDYLSAWESTSKKISWVQPAPPQGVRAIVFGFSEELVDTILQVVTANPDVDILFYCPLSDGTTFAVLTYTFPDTTKPLVGLDMLGAASTVFWRNQLPSQRNRRLVLFSNNPAEQGYLLLWELGGVANSVLPTESYDTLSQNEILASNRRV